MASAQNQPANVDLFDLYFRKADLDRDGRISGLEAVTFFQASGLPKPVLAKVWDYADQNRTGFLGRAEFYNALKLVTVAQKKRELTPEIVKAALYGPAAAKIPAPQINLAGVPAQQPNTSAQAAAPQAGIVASSTPQSLGFGGSQPPLGVNLSQQQLSSQASPLRPQVVSASALQPTQGAPTQGFPVRGAVAGPSLPNSSISSDWTGGRMGGPPSGTVSQVPNRGVTSSMTPHGFGISTLGHETSLLPRPQAPSATPSRPDVRDPKQMAVSGNGFASNSFFGEGAFSATQPQPRQESSALSAPNSSTTSPLSAANQPSVRPNAFESLQTSFAMQPVGGQPRPSQSILRPAQRVSAASTSTFSSSVVSPPTANAPSSQSQMPWPKMTQMDVQKYMKVFVEVDKDKDEKITGEQARNLFLSWRLPREILKQVWDLSDQDNDSMLSLREFCIALYLLERYREGRTLPTVLPSNIVFDQPGQPSGGYANAAWVHASGLQQQGMAAPVSQHMAHSARGRPPRPPAAPPSDDAVQPRQQKKVPVLEKHLVDQLSKEEQSSLRSKFQEAMDADKKVEELEKEIMDSKEKIEFCRTKMQELVLYKSRCDNRVNEIVERASGDKREVEALAKKYEEKCWQAGDVASKLTIEEATFRDLQEKKMELYRAIVSMEKDGGADGALQGHAEHIQTDLDDLVKNLNERCKKYGLRAKPTSLLELPFGWQSGIQDTAADWDEDWDKFEEEGFTFVKELTLDVQNVIAPPKQKSSSAQVVKPSAPKSPVAATSSPHADVDKEKPLTSDGHMVENGIHHNKNEDGTPKSAPSSPAATSTIESPSRDFVDSGYGKTTTVDSSLHYDKETQSDHEAAGSVFSGDRNFDEPAWGTFDTNDDVDSVWGFNPVSSSKDTDHEGFKDDYLFGSMEFGLNPIRTGMPQAGFQKSVFFDESVPSTPLYASGFSPKYSEPSRPSFDSSSRQKKSIFFDESVPSTPLYTSGFSPKYSEPSGPSFDSSSRFDSFNMHDSGVFSQRDPFSRFDSFNTQDSGTFPQRDMFSRFDSFNTHDSESFPQRETLTRFDSMRSSVDFDQGHGFPSFDDSDPFGTGPFRTSKEGQTPRSTDNWGHTPKSSDNWSAF
ncbi:epidermal growth factor receptor substrate 15-like 1 [Rhodamnia argentea]|uniref:Epidermal growth factor receptor substrate 15-like 1 n=1 Tax=Rhodamnia argentea TaxID=178133 RepID=A0A8B8MS82_9MYRT|nr:epidermal growth factor receptor substrate 15-like 1 [Rhodamnia argentea]